MEPDFSLKRVLVVDDLGSDLALIHCQLQSIGFNDIIEARNGQSALSLLSQREVDVVITDLHMAPMDGIEFTRKMRESVKSRLPVLMVSVIMDRMVTQRALDAGVTQFLVKPFRSAALRARLTSILGGADGQVGFGSISNPDRRLVFNENFAQRRKSDRENLENERSF